MFKLFIPTCLILLMLVGIQVKANAQYTIAHVEIEGNAKTKPYIILRELPYREGTVVAVDSIAALNNLAPSR